VNRAAYTRSETSKQTQVKVVWGNSPESLLIRLNSSRP
jgi:hypothetical protein